ncbi:MAG: hypothetical protein KJ876_01600 [Alphaproteobacteria bacterium]|jgi:hypothetical protein|uniref:hypothetical protein n=1 Tax=unclassified Sphingopyxis TaxID=2614943 RepID=UPI0010F4404A|nr:MULTISPECIES: hypothetical protein [unclassified Sphingopyxis]MBN8842758.1 hypothetical protein [Sphingomonadales bacterium]MBU0866843.1 hypothetical protein [Alphaproteobacteria bacterium]MBA4750639.1 hypothetical protein [Sphingopyxis sp.]MBK6412947.1 hypothetical protein [Sphingopyxis sp.]MBU1464120.1 hypothetical protein [Alphaproteobacteria bacterium]
MIADIQLDSEQKFPTGSQKVVRPLRNTAVLGLNGGDIHCRLALCFVAKANHCALPARQGAFDSRGGPMKNGIKLLADNTYGRVEISNRKEFKHFNLRPSKKAVEEIERLEELTLAAEQRLGNFVVGANRG